jgi:hypothetical protein
MPLVRDEGHAGAGARWRTGGGGGERTWRQRQRRCSAHCGGKIGFDRDRTGAMSQSKEPATSALTGPRSARPRPRSFFAIASVLGNCDRLATLQTCGQFQAVERNSSTAEVRCAAAKWSGEVGRTEAQFNSTGCWVMRSLFDSQSVPDH